MSLKFCQSTRKTPCLPAIIFQWLYVKLRGCKGVTFFFAAVSLFPPWVLCPPFFSLPNLQLFHVVEQRFRTPWFSWAALGCFFDAILRIPFMVFSWVLHLAICFLKNCILIHQCLRDFILYQKEHKLYILSIISRYKSYEIIAYFPEKRLNPKVPRLWWSKCLMHLSTDRAKFPETSFGFPEGYKMGTY